MKKKLSVLFILVLLLTSLFSVSALADDNASIDCPNDEHIYCQNKQEEDVVIKIVTKDELSRILSERTELNQLRTKACCPLMEHAWRIVEKYHEFDTNNGGMCLSVTTFKEQYCIYCNHKWQSTFTIDFKGCGKIHT